MYTYQTYTWDTHSYTHTQVDTQRHTHGHTRTVRPVLTLTLRRSTYKKKRSYWVTESFQGTLCRTLGPSSHLCLVSSSGHYYRRGDPPTVPPSR